MAWFGRNKEKELRKLVAEWDLPPFPGATFEALAAIRDEDASLQDIAEKLSVDPGLSVRALRLVNSVGFGLRHPVDDLPHAVQLIGRSSLESLLISIGVRQALPGKHVPGFDPARFWRTAAWRATLARRFAVQLCASEASRCFTVGLLQDLAVPLLVERLGEPYAAMLAEWCEGGPPLHEREAEAHGWDHAAVAAAICASWGLPEPLAGALADHHAEPGEEVEAPAPILLAAFLRDAETRVGIDEMVAAAEERHGLERDALTEWIDESLEEAGQLAEMLG